MTTEPSDALLRRILTNARVFAMVGVSMNPVRPSYFVARYLSLKGFRVIPVNPGHGGERLFGQTVYPDLASIPDDAKVDVLDIFRRSEAVPQIVEEAMAHLPDLGTVWMQIGVTHKQAAAQAEAAGLTVIQNHCPKIEYQRLFGELRMGGFATGVISSKL
ncbi:CoA-binding protein [Maritimibacter sp. 55A14]|uniref:CoA-binding protein n=1 Tax=Maritimibacter sp. 55A14 TaxID=2174844 RepID=UPI000D61BA81|nr:CoA-binding protein [Maritimibacter sp. 55A14]PWE30491.1 CoA-binding protein [Maritimibacter sp. 55A14]